MNFPELNDEQLDRIRTWLSSDDNTAIKFKFDYYVTGENIKSLRDYEWIDNMVISFYMKMLTKRSEDQNDLPKVFGFGTEFWAEYERNHYDYKSIKSLTNGKDLFAYNIIMVPVHENGNHWTLATISINKKIIITYYNSMGHKNDYLLEHLVEYLKTEYLNRKGVRLNYEIQRQCCEIQQENDFDCGAVICSIAELLSRNGSIEFQLFTEENMAHFRQVMIYEICSGQMLRR